MAASIKDNSASHSGQCQRCGTCCRKGGPALHLEDQDLVDSGKIPLKHLLTIRQGEPAYDNVSGSIAPAVTDIIKIKSRQKNDSACIFYEYADKRCRIHQFHPAECAALRCWDTREIENLYNCRRLTRRHLLSKVEGLWELVAHHQEHCDYEYIAELAAKVRQNPPSAAAEKELLEMLRFDRHLREVTLERAGLESGILEFLFGRLLARTIDMFGLKLKRSERGMTLEPVGASDGQVCYRRNGF